MKKDRTNYLYYLESEPEPPEPSPPEPEPPKPPEPEPPKPPGPEPPKPPGPEPPDIIRKHIEPDIPWEQE